jgi:hypothetical protein
MLRGSGAPAHQLFQSPVFSLITLPVLFFRRARGPAAAEKALDGVSGDYGVIITGFVTIPGKRKMAPA